MDDYTMKTTIARITRFAKYKVSLECGHTFECSSEDIDRQQLFIGKKIECPQCQEAAR